MVRSASGVIMETHCPDVPSDDRSVSSRLVLTPAEVRSSKKKSPIASAATLQL